MKLEEEVVELPVGVDDMGSGPDGSERFGTLTVDEEVKGEQKVDLLVPGCSLLPSDRQYKFLNSGSARPAPGLSWLCDGRLY